MKIQMRPVVVLDNNVLRNDREIDQRVARFRDFEEQFALPEIAFFEMTKHPSAWEDTTRRSLLLVSDCCEAIVITHSMKRMIAAEERSGDPTQSVVSPNATRRVREVLHDLQMGGGGDFSEFIRSLALFRDELDHGGHARDSHAIMKNLRETAARSLIPSSLARVGEDLAINDRRSFRELLIAALPPAAHGEALVRRGVPVALAKRLTEQPSVSALYAMALGAIALEWTVRRGIETANPQRVGNDVTDIEYAIAAIWIGDMLSVDGRARERYKDLQMLGAAAWPDSAHWLTRGRAIEPVHKK